MISSLASGHVTFSIKIAVRSRSDRNSFVDVRQRVLVGPLTLLAFRLQSLFLSRVKSGEAVGQSAGLEARACCLLGIVVCEEEGVLLRKLGGLVVVDGEKQARVRVKSKRR